MVAEPTLGGRWAVERTRPVEGVAPASWTRRGPPQHLPTQNAPRSWLCVPLLLDAAGQLQVAASAAWRGRAVLGAHWGSWLAQLRGAPPAALDQARAAVSLHQALDARPVQWWPHEAFEGMRGDAPCSLPLLVARCQAPDGYLLAPFQEALLQLYGGASLAAEIAGTADAASAGADLASRMPCPGPAALAPRDDAAVAAAARLAAPRRRRRPRRQRRAEGEVDARAAPANAVAPPAPPSAGEQRDPLQAMRGVDLAHELRRRVYTLQSPHGPTRGALKAALTAGLTEIQRDPSSAEGWKLFLLAPRMLLYRGRGETRVPRAELGELSAASAALTAMPILLNAAASLAFAASLTCASSPGLSASSSPGLSNLDGPAPEPSEVLAACPCASAPSRMPGR